MKPFEIYDALIDGLPENVRVKTYINGKIWTMSELEDESLNRLLQK